MSFFHSRNFSFYDRQVGEYLDLVYSNSYKYYKDNFFDKGSSYDLDNDLDCLVRGIKYLEDFLYYYFEFYFDDFDRIFYDLKNNIHIVSLLPVNERGIFGKVDIDNKLFMLNPSLTRSDTLTSEERTRLYTFHELGHVVNARWMNSAISHVNSLPDDRDTKQLLLDGFSLVDEVATQERAEEMTYYFTGKQRPSLYKTSRRQLYNGEQYLTNFDYYGELEEPAFMFASTIRGIGNKTTMESIIKELSIRTLDDKFVDKLISEYERDGHLNDLYTILEYMGIIFNASYALFGYSDKKYLSSSKMAFDSLDKITLGLADTRDPYNY